MWTAVLLYSLVVLTAADNGWKQSEQYRYNIEARTFTGQHQIDNHFTGSLVRGKLQVNVDSEYQLTLQVKEAKHADINQKLDEGWATHIPETQAEYKVFPTKNQPFQIHIRNGVVQKMVVSKDIPTWELNFLKSIASQFQVDIQGKNLKYSKTNNKPHDDQDSPVFSTMEESINGRYETIYDVSLLPEYFLQSRPELAPLEHLKGDGEHYRIVKTRNFSNSNEHVVYHYGMSGHEGWSEGTNTMGNFLARTSQSTIVYSGNHSQFTIQSTETTEIILVAPHLFNNQKGIVASRMNLTLEEVNTSKGSSPPIDNPETVESLVYKYEPVGNQPGEKEKYSSSPSSSSEESSHSSSKSEEEQAVLNFNQKIKRNIRSSMLTETKENTVGQNSDSSSHSSTTSSDSSISSSEEILDPQPDLNSAPNIEFLPDNMLNHQRESEQTSRKIEHMANKIGELLDDPNEIPNNNALSRFSLLTRLAMSANTKQLLQASDKLYYPEEKTKTDDPERYKKYRTWQTYRDAVAHAGNGPALVTMSSWIKSGKVRGNEAAQLLAVVPKSARYPTTEYMNYFFELVKSEEVQNQKFLNDSAILSFSDLVRRSQVDRHSSHHRYPIHLSGARSHNHRLVVEQNYIPYLQRQLENAIAQADSMKIQVYIRALCNTAHPKILAVFERYLEEKSAISNFQRLLIVAFLDHFIKVYPSIARSVLYRIYRNQGEVPEVRVAAVAQIMKTNPSAHLLQHMAEHTNYDQSKQVNAAVKAAIESAANSDHNANPYLVNNARSAIDFLSPEKYGDRYSKHLIHSYLVKEVENLRYSSFVSSIQGPDGLYPDAVLYNQNYNIGGYFPERFTASYMTSGAEQLIESLLKRLKLNNDPPRRGPLKPNDGRNGRYTYQYISDMLNWQSNEPVQVEGNFFGSVLGGERFFPFDNNTVNRLPEIFRQINSNLKKGITYQESKFYNQYSVEMGFPLATGVQFTYSISVPTYVHLNFTGDGYLHQTQDYSRNDNIPISAGMNGKLKFVWSNQKRGKMGFIAKYSQQRYLTVLEKNTQLYLPLKGNLDVNWYNLRASLQFLDDNRDLQKIFQHKTNLYTTYQNVNDVKPYQEGRNVQFIRVGPKKTFQNSFGDQKTGYRFQIEVASEDNFQDTGRAFYAFLKQGPEIFSNILYGDIFNNYAVLSYDSKNSSPHETAISFTYKDQAPEARKMISEIRKKKSEGRKKKTKGYDLEDEASEEIFTKEKHGIEETSMSLLAASISFGGNQENGLYVFTLVHTDSPVSTKSRYQIYYSGKPFQESEDTKEFEATAEIVVTKPQLAIFDFNDAINLDATSVIEGHISFMKPDKSKMAFRGKLLQSKNRKQYLRGQPSAAICQQQMMMGNNFHPTCLRLIENVHYLDKYNFSITYDKLPTIVKNMGQTFYGMVRHYGYDYIDEEVIDVPTEGGQMNLGVQFTENLRKVNLSIEAPALQAHFENVPIKDWARPLLVQHSRYSPLELFTRKIIYSDHNPTCSLQANISTFSNISYPVKFGDCYHVLAMSVPHRPLRSQQSSQECDYDHRNFSILVKDAGIKKKILKVLLSDDILTLEPIGPREVSFNINDRTVNISENKITGWSNGKNELKVYALRTDNAIVLDVNSHGIQLIYNGISVQLTMSSHYSNKVRGLCGVSDGELDSDFTTPGNCIMKNHQDFTASYAVNDNSCQGPAKEMHLLARNVPCYSKETIRADVISDTEAGRSKRSESLKSTPNNKFKTSCHILQVKTVQDGENTCFSVRPQLTCNSHCKPKSSIEKPIDFFCIPDSVATKHWVGMVNMGISPDFSNKMANHNMNISLPKDCVMI